MHHSSSIIIIIIIKGAKWVILVMSLCGLVEVELTGSDRQRPMGRCPRIEPRFSEMAGKDYERSVKAKIHVKINHPQMLGLLLGLLMG